MKFDIVDFGERAVGNLLRQGVWFEDIIAVLQDMSHDPHKLYIRKSDFWQVVTPDDFESFHSPVDAVKRYVELLVEHDKKEKTTKTEE